MKATIEIFGDTIGDVIDGMKAATRKMCTEVVLQTGNNRGAEIHIKPITTKDNTLSHRYTIHVTNKTN